MPEEDWPRDEKSRGDNDGNLPMESESFNGRNVQATPEYEPRPVVDYVEQLTTKTDVDALEAGVKIGNQLLDSLKAPLNAAVAADDAQAAIWLKSIQQIQESAEPVRVIVGVVGNTGAGKSSVINALLDEEKLVPTNGMRACTASATEISFNYSDDPNQLYRAEVEFITAADWSQELNTLLDDLIDGSGNVSRECNNPETDAGLAYSKIKAVYPHKTKDMIAKSQPDGLANEPAVRDVLGSVKRLNETTARALFEGLQQYVDSKEKKAGKDKRMEYWPLIKVVRIYCKASALSTGAVIVDLPGVQDSNAARAAVAESYMKACTGLWITAAIQRAVDDRTAKKLLGDSFKRQLKYDGQYSAVTLICTKTDDLLESEVSRSLDLDSEVGEGRKQIDGLYRQRTKLKSEIGDLKDQKSAIDTTTDELDAKMDQWEELGKMCSKGKTVYRPAEIKKRKRESEPRRQQKRHAPSGFDSDSDDNDDSNDIASDGEDNQEPPAQEDRRALKEDEIEQQLASFKVELKELRKSKKKIKSEIAELRKKVAEITSQANSLISQVKSICIKGRNEYSKRVIKDDFALGVKEIDQEAAFEEDENAFDPDQEARDYKEVARNLPVFCVSSRAYQKLSGRLQDDSVHINGFLTIDDTEIPQLQKHTKNLTKGGRVSSSRRFLHELGQLLNSLKLWITDDGRLAPDKELQRIDEMFLCASLDRLLNILHSAIVDCVTDFRVILTHKLGDAFDRWIPKACENAVPTATGWGAHRSMGGLAWATYKATCRRSGVFAGASGAKDFNADLFEPISKHLAGPWETIFQRRLPDTLDRFVTVGKEGIQCFHQDAISGLQNPRKNPLGVNMLHGQIRAEISLLAGLSNHLRTIIAKKQRDVNREFTPVIREAMEDAYTICVHEEGQGSYAHMKEAMQSHVEGARNYMFQAATDQVKNDLVMLCQEIQKVMILHVEDVAKKLKRDYVAVLLGTGPLADGAERIICGEMRQLLSKVDFCFAELLGPDEHAS